jgi:riboflavin synthase
VDGEGFTCELTGETLARTAFAERLRPGSRVNLERPLRADGRFDGHLVQGHVDGVGKVRALDRQGDGAQLEVALPKGLERYVVEKGSIAVDGVSLTVAGVAPGLFRVALIPYTLDHTSLGQARVGGPVNLEVDVIAKYVERLLGAARR